MLAAQQFAQYGMTNVPDEYVEKYAEDFLKNKDYRQRLIESRLTTSCLPLSKRL